MYACGNVFFSQQLPNYNVSFSLCKTNSRAIYLLHKPKNFFSFSAPKIFHIWINFVPRARRNKKDFCLSEKYLRVSIGEDVMRLFYSNKKSLLMPPEVEVNINKSSLFKFRRPQAMNNYFLARKSMNFNDGDMGSFTLWWTEFESLVFFLGNRQQYANSCAVFVFEPSRVRMARAKNKSNVKSLKNVINYAWKLQTMLRCV